MERIKFEFCEKEKVFLLALLQIKSSKDMQKWWKKADRHRRKDIVTMLGWSMLGNIINKIPK